MKELRFTVEENSNFIRAKDHSKLTWKEFLNYVAQLYWKVEVKKRHRDLK
ncbi:hypothetical protein M0R04_15645 [Candidatus Dojkabacteria bacterium]|jgi:hypothetical protein|nr:hypothetical protein [Candidatus Dojkabacteria bacterium]